jgi:hypothetical protein
MTRSFRARSWSFLGRFRPSRMNGTKSSSARPGEWAQVTGANRFREAERVAAVQLDVLPHQW